jgi:hypothetical protein
MRKSPAAFDRRPTLVLPADSARDSLAGFQVTMYTGLAIFILTAQHFKRSSKLALI